MRKLKDDSDDFHETTRLNAFQSDVLVQSIEVTLDRMEHMEEPLFGGREWTPNEAVVMREAARDAYAVSPEGGTLVLYDREIAAAMVYALEFARDELYDSSGVSGADVKVKRAMQLLAESVMMQLPDVDSD